MKILLIGNYDKDHQYSMQKFSICLQTGLEQEGHEVELLKPQPIFGYFFKSTVSGLAKWFGYIDKYILFPIILIFKAKYTDILHISDHSNSIYIPFIKKHPHVITCHDMMAVRSALDEFKLYNQVRKTGKIQQILILNGLKEAKHISAVSNATKHDLLRLTKHDANQIKVIHNGLNFYYKSLSKEACLNILDRYNINPDFNFLLHVGGNQWYKNRKGVLFIYNALIKKEPNINVKLVLAGKPLTHELSFLIKDLGLSEHVIVITEPTNQELNALYCLTKGLIFPSLCEGFGWPIIEAQACGSLVFTSNYEPMTEVGGEAAIYFDPLLPDEAAKIIVNTISDHDSIEKKLHLNKSNIDKFSTQSMIKNYIAYYELILTGH